jgi:hypothetical protein
MPDEAIQLEKCALTASCRTRATWKRQPQRTDRYGLRGSSACSASVELVNAVFCNALSVTAFLFTLLGFFRRKTARFGRLGRLRGRRPESRDVGGISSSRELIFPFFSLARCPSRVPQARPERASVFRSVYGQPQSS